MSSPGDLQRLVEYLEKGLITREEFDQEKRKLLSSGGSSSSRPTSLGSYRITGEIGVGGMGRVYRGRHRTAAFATRQGGDVAIKVLHPQYAERAEIVERFEREAALGIKLDHPGIVRVHELVVDAGRVGLVMELVEGRSMSKMIGFETGPIPWARGEPMFRQLLDAVSYAHAHGVVHRDLKPENVMVDAEGHLEILDFGIAKDMASGRTKTGTGMGTVHYMAPEQYIDAKAVDVRADIYALGMTLYEMLAGRLPWNEETSEFEILKRKESGQIPAPTVFYPEIPPEIVDLVMGMIRPDPEERVESCEDVGRALERAKQAAASREVATGEAESTETPRKEWSPTSYKFAALILLGVVGLGILASRDDETVREDARSPWVADPESSKEAPEASETSQASEAVYCTYTFHTELLDQSGWAQVSACLVTNLETENYIIEQEELGAKIRQRFTRIVASRSKDEIEMPGGKERLRQAMLEAVQSMLEPLYVKEVDLQRLDLW